MSAAMDCPSPATPPAGLGLSYRIVGGRHLFRDYALPHQMVLDQGADCGCGDVVSDVRCNCDRTGAPLGSAQADDFPALAAIYHRHLAQAGAA